MRFLWKAFRALILVTPFFISVDAVCQAVEFTSSNLPIIILDTHGQEIPDEPKIEADMGIIYNGVGQRNFITDAFNNYSGKIGIEIRGSSSQMFPKKQYGIELRDALGNGINASLLGMPKEEDWVLFAPYNDKSLMRDVLAYRLARDEGRYAPRTRYCEVVLNGEYMGIYVLIEKIKRDKNRVNINKLDPDEISGDDLTGGYIIKIDKTTGGGDGWLSAYTPPLRSGEQQIQFLYEVPKSEDIVPEQKQYIRQYMNLVEDALAASNFKDPVNGYAKYIDPASFIDYFIINEVSKNVDGYRLSTFMYKRRDSDGGKLFMGPVWDYNLGFGNADYCTNGNPEGFAMEFNSVCSGDYWLVPFWWNRLMEDIAFRRQLTERWNVLREGPLKTSTVHTFIDSVATVLDQESQQRNFQRWPVLGQYVWPNYYVGSSFSDEVNWLKNWVTNRMNWLDETITGLVTATDEEMTGFRSVSIYPNPASAETPRVEFYTDRPGAVEISVINASGASQQKVSLFVEDSGRQLKALEAVPEPGVYLVILRFQESPPKMMKMVIF